jgi:DDE superfamily endonuclease
MLNLPKGIIQVLRCFEEVFSERVWEWAKVLVIGAILAPGERRVTAILRVMGLHQERQFQNYHRVLNRATWSSRALSRLLLRLLIQLFVPEDAPIVVGIDETIERRRGAKIAAKGIYRDPVRSSKEFFVKTSGLRWISMMLLTPIPWAQRVWALPFFSVLAPSERYNQQHRCRHKKLTDWGRQMIRQLRRWLPGRRLVVVADSCGTSSHAACFHLGSVLLTRNRALKAVVTFHCETSLCFSTPNNKTVCYAPDYITQGSLPSDSDDCIILCAMSRVLSRLTRLRRYRGTTVVKSVKSEQVLGPRVSS